MLQIDLWKRLCIWGVVALGLWLALPNAFYPKVEAHNDAVAAIEAGTAETPEIAQALSQWPD
ncbi:MAG: protein translocase subunit SecD, partial [Roseovarius sp.]|nr:protein translocase subunit SecD [Roseovarius sp.]